MEAFNRISLAEAGIYVAPVESARGRWRSFLLSRWPRFLAILLFYAVMAAVGVSHSGNLTPNRTPVAAVSS